MMNVDLERAKEFYDVALEVFFQAKNSETTEKEFNETTGKAMDLLLKLYKPLSKNNSTGEDDMELKGLKQRIDEVHPYKIYRIKDGRYETKVKDQDKPEGRRSIKAKSEKVLYQKLYEHYFPSDNTVQKHIEEWFDWKTTASNTSNIERMKKSYKTYFLNADYSQNLLNTQIDRLTVNDLRDWMETLLKKKPMNKKGFRRETAPLKGTLDFAFNRELIPNNIWDKALGTINQALFKTDMQKADEEEFYTIDEYNLIYKEIMRVYNDPSHNGTASTAGLGILLQFQTGLRVGELLGLKYSDIEDSHLTIKRQSTNGVIIEQPKTKAGFRKVPLTQQALQIIDMIKERNEKKGYTADWLFQSNNANSDYRMAYDAINRKLKKVCDAVNIPYRSSHSIRKTVATLLAKSGNTEKFIQTVLGHSLGSSITQEVYIKNAYTEEEMVSLMEGSLM